jgi:putative sigma-54 modulation protein
MHIRLGSRKVVVSRSLQEYIRTQLRMKLARFAAAIGAVKVELFDRNGRRGGGDKCCRIQLTLAQGERIVCDDIRASLRHAARGAMDRLERAVQRRVRVLPA